jgi:hypothetical protein
MFNLITSPVDWSNVEKCAQKRADEKTFNWDEDSNPLGDLETREMARLLGYRHRLIRSIWDDIL